MVYLLSKIIKKAKEFLGFIVANNCHQ